MLINADEFSLSDNGCSATVQNGMSGRNSSAAPMDIDTQATRIHCHKLTESLYTSKSLLRRSHLFTSHISREKANRCDIRLYRFR